MNKEQKIGIGIMIFIVLGATLLGWQLLSIDKAEDRACQELGFERGEFRLSQDYCEDSEYNLHYVKMECNLFPPIHCEATKISVGDVRVKQW